MWRQQLGSRGSLQTCRAAELLYWPHELEMMWAPSFAQYSKHKMAFDSRPVPLASKNLQAARQQGRASATHQKGCHFTTKLCMGSSESEKRW